MKSTSIWLNLIAHVESINLTLSVELCSVRTISQWQAMAMHFSSIGEPKKIM